MKRKKNVADYKSTEKNQVILKFVNNQYEKNFRLKLWQNTKIVYFYLVIMKANTLECGIHYP